MSRTILLVFLAYVSACHAERPSTLPLQDGMPSYGDFARSINSYPYMAPPARAAQIKAGLPTIKLCMSKEEVQKLLGTPDYSQVSCGKNISVPCHGSSWQYYLAKRNSDANIFDPGLYIVFNVDNRLSWVSPTGIEGASEIGDPSHRNACT